MKIGVPEIDWLTFTTWENTVFNAWQDWQKTIQGDQKTGKIRNYEGEWKGSSFIGEGRQKNKAHGMIRVSGSDSHTAYFDLMRCGYAKCTRLDIQLTLDLPENYSARIFADDLRADQVGDCQRSILLMENSDGLNTVYVGSRKSDRFARFYIKAVGALGEEERFLRFEVEHKGDWARVISENIMLGNADMPGILLDFLGSIEVDDSQGIIRIFKDHLNGVKAGLIVPRENRDNNKTMNWILEQVTPAMIRILNDHDLGHYLADHLSGLIETFYKAE